LFNQVISPCVPELYAIAKPYFPVNELLPTTNKTDVTSAHSYVASVTPSDSVCRTKAQMQVFVVHKLATGFIDNVSSQCQFNTAKSCVRGRIRIKPHLTGSRVVPEVSILAQVLRAPILDAALGPVIENYVPDVHVECFFGINLVAEIARAHAKRRIWERRGRCRP
jgi:hypothetical protein